MRRSLVTISIALVAVMACTKSDLAAVPPPPLPSAAQSESPVEPEEGAPVSSPLGPVYAKALLGDVRGALAKLADVDPATLQAKDREAYDCFLARFERREQTPIEGIDDPVVGELVRLYRSYWTAVMLRERSRELGEADLLAALRTFLRTHGHRTHPVDLNAATAELGTLLDERGYRSIRGVTQPYWELMAWKTETEERYEVELPETTVTVNVVFMDGFATLGWTGYATCGKYFSGGWATRESLHCVRSAYALESEAFKVNYLAHEAQHFADYVTFPKLEQPELEYRGKLTELAKAHEGAHALVRRFAATRGTERSTPHNLANGWVASDMAARLLGDAGADPAGFSDVPMLRINEAAEALLRASTKTLQALGAADVTRFADR